ncbi:MAG: efflux RND transporter periplasmic adaptor subunit [Patescibacteria group bacterium]|jgi:RND family efflux transporter MFP subunit
MKKKIIIILLVIFILAAGFFFFRKTRAQSSNFKIETVQSGEMLVSTSASGKIKAERDAILKFQTAGLMNWVGVKKGDLVKKGQAIASLDKADLQKRLKKQLNLYQTERNNFEQTQEDYKETRDNLLLTDEIRRILDSTQLSLDNTVLDVELASLSLKYATIYSPIEGIVVSIDEPYAGVNILPTTATFRIVDPKSIYFEAKIDETDISRVKVGYKARIELDAFPEQVFEGVVSKIDFDSTVTSGGGTAYNVWIQFPSLSEDFRLGMNGDVEIIRENIANATLIPLSALTEKDQKTYVWKVEDGKAKKVEVTIGNTDDDYVQILTGLSAGDSIISSNISLLKEGMAIKP